MTPEYLEKLKKSSIHKLRGLNRLALEENDEARKAYLTAAIAELEALSTLEAPDPLTVERHLTEAIGCLKGAFVKTGLVRRLPNPPFRRQ
jgi:hypothetical protein